jgi:fructoselysine-6-phosphate deglycase
LPGHSGVSGNEAAVLNFDETRFLRIQSSAVGLVEVIDDVVGEALAVGVSNLHFTGTGGVAILLEPAAQLLRRRSSFPLFNDRPAETMAAGSPN